MSSKCKYIDKADRKKMLKRKEFKHKWLFDPTLHCCPATGIWALCYADGEGMFCDLYQMHDSMHPQLKSKVWNETPNVWYRPQTVQDYFLRNKEVKESMHSTAAQKEDFKHNSHFAREDKKERNP